MNLCEDIDMARGMVPSALVIKNALVFHLTTINAQNKVTWLKK